MQDLIAKKQADEATKKSWVIFFIYITVFINSYVFFHEPFDFYIGYLIFLILLPRFILKYGFTGPLFYVFFVLFFTGLFHIFTGNNTPEQFFKVYLGLTMSYFFYNYVIIDHQFDVQKLFEWYLKGCYIVGLLGLVQLVGYLINFEPLYNFRMLLGLNKWSLQAKGAGLFGFRLNSVFGEPTYLGTTMSAAFFVAIYNLFSKNPFYYTRTQNIVIIAVYFLSFSGLGQVGILLTFLFLGISYGMIKYAIVFIPIMIAAFNFMHNNLKEFRERYDSLVDLFANGKFVLGKTHGSSFILYNNYHVALENFKRNFLFGTGVGSHPIAFEQFTIAGEIAQYGFNLNSQDANSMLLRLISETGIFGVSLFFFIIFKFYVKRDPNFDTRHWIMSNGILIMMLLNLFRQGHYFINGFPLFVLLYIYNSIAYKKIVEERKLSVLESLSTSVRS